MCITSPATSDGKEESGRDMKKNANIVSSSRRRPLGRNHSQSAGPLPSYPTTRQLSPKANRAAFARISCTSHLALRMILIAILLIVPWQLSVSLLFDRHLNGTENTVPMIPSALPTNRTLVVLTGNLRGGEKAWKSLYEHVLDVNDADLAVLIGATPMRYKNASLFQRARYVWTVAEYDDWADAMEQIEDKDHDWRERLFGMIANDPGQNILLGAARNISGSGAIVFMFRWYLSQYIKTLTLTDLYDRFVVTRADHYYQCAHNLSLLDPQYLWVPEGEDYFGICDRHFVANSSTVLAALDILPPLVKNPERYRRVLRATYYNTERFLFLRWYEQGLGPAIRRFQRNMFSVATGDDETRWQKPNPENEFLPQLFVKYRGEYLASIKTCQLPSEGNMLVDVPGFVSKPDRKTLVIATGSLRGGEKTWHTLYKNVLDVNNADLALIVGEPPPHYKHPTLYGKAKYLWGVPEYEDWVDAMELIENKDPDWRERLFGLYHKPPGANILLGAAHGIPGSGAIVFMIRWFLTQQLIQHQMTSRYDQFVVTRLDHYYECAHDLSVLDPQFLWVPTGQSYGGICDRHFFTGKDMILPALNVLPPLVQYPERYRSQLSSEKYNTERFLLLRWEQEGLSTAIRFFDRVMFLAAADGDVTRWAAGKNKTVAKGVHIKYPAEYGLSRKTCLSRPVPAMSMGIKKQRISARRPLPKKMKRRSILVAQQQA